METAFFQDPTSMALMALMALTVLALGVALMGLVFERQSAQQSQQRHNDINNRLLEMQDEFAKLEKLQFLAAQRQQRTEQVLQDMYSMLEEHSRALHGLKEQPTHLVNTTTNDIPSQSNYEHAIRMAKEGMSGEQIQEICGLSEGEVNLLLDLHQS